MSERPGDFLKRGRMADTEAERLALMDDFDEMEYEREVEARALARRRRHPCTLYEGSLPSEAERIQSPESAL